MRKWSPPGADGRLASAGARAGGGAVGASALAAAGGVLAQAIDQLGEPGFQSGLLRNLGPVLPAASWAVYRTGLGCRPALFMSSSHGVPDTTRDCWQAYLAGPYRADRSLHLESAAAAPGSLQLCHISAREVAHEHRACIYEAHGVAERLSIVQTEGPDHLFAVNFYRHQHQRAFTDAQVSDFEVLSPALLALVRKHLQVAQHTAVAPSHTGSTTPAQRGMALEASELRQRLQALCASLTARELEVCERLLQGMTQEGIAADLGLGLPTVKTYRNRAFARLGIHFRNELFARVLSPMD